MMSFHGDTHTGGVMPDDAEDDAAEDSIGDLIDDLNDRYAGEAWLDKMIDEGTAGRYLRKLAQRVLDYDEDPDLALFALQTTGTGHA